MHVSRVIHGKTGYFSMPDSDWDFHMLRHTHASELIAAGVSPLSVQKRLGDSRLEQYTDTMFMRQKQIKRMKLA